jgi:hypothetical protein
MLTPVQIEAARSMMNHAVSTLHPKLELDGPLNDFTKDELRLIAGALGHELKAREVEEYLKMEQSKWKDDVRRRGFLDELMSVVSREIELLEFYDPSVPRQTEFPLPATIKITNLNTGASDSEMPMEEFLQMLRDVTSSSIFKR